MLEKSEYAGKCFTSKVAKGTDIETFNKLHKLEEDNKRLKQKVETVNALKSRLQEVETQKRNIENRFNEVSARLDMVYASTSWKVTRPLRILGGILLYIKQHINKERYNNSDNNDNSCNGCNIGNDNMLTVSDSAQLSNHLCYRKPADEIEIPVEWLEILPHQYVFSVIFAVKNCKENQDTIVKALMSCQTQKYKNYEIIIICPEKEKDEIDETARSIDLDKYKIITFSNEKTDLEAAWRLGVGNATGDFIGILRQEDFFACDAFSYFEENLNENPKVKIISCYNAVKWNGEICFVDRQDGIDRCIWGKEKIRSFSFFSKECAEYLFEKTDEVQNILDNENYIVIPCILYFSTPVKSAWNEHNIRCLAFYLPQFHEIPENNEWWGKGFTEWTNVRKAKPQFVGHHQPRIPIKELGYYDLGDRDGLSVQIKQIEMAKAFGLSGFCYYYYWFDNGKRLLEKPLNRHLNNKELDLPFCLCWANENWTRTWDGHNDNVLMAQTYGGDWERKFAEDLLPYINDPRYIRVNGAPFLLIYNLADIKNAAESIEKIRKIVYEHGIKRIHISAVRRTPDAKEFAQSGYTIDSLTDFPPHLLFDKAVHDNGQMLGMDPGHINDYRKACEYFSNMDKQNYTYFRTTMLEWDNTPRRGRDGFVFEDFSYEYYKKWLYAIKRYTERQNRPGEDLMFINAWNEWGEGTILEPDERNGYKALETTKEVLEMR